MAQDPLNLVCIEPHFPGRLGAVADWLVRRRGYRCQFFCHRTDPQATWPEATGRGLELVPFEVGGVAREPSVAWTRGLERGLCYAYGAWEVIEARRPRPVDLVLGRSAGLGSTLFASVALPNVPAVNLFDYYYAPHAHDLAGAAGPEMPVEYFYWRRAANAMDLLDLENGVVPWAPTAWQRDLFPAEYWDDFLVLFDGVDARRFRRGSGPDRPRRVAGRDVPAGAKVVSFVARHLDWLRGFDRFLALANRLMRERSDVICVAAGGGPVARMLDVRWHGRDFAAACLAADPPPDPDRLWLPGTLPPAAVAELLAATDLHIDPSRPYAVSRSLVEALASDAIVLAWDAPPVREFVAPGRTGLLAPPDDPEAAARLALAALADPAAHRPLAETAAMEARERFAQDVTLPRLATLFDGLASGGPRRVDLGGLMPKGK